MNNFIKRSITGIGFVSITALMILLSKWTLFALLIFFNIIAQIEFFRLVKHDKSKPIFFSAVSLGVLLITFCFLYFEGTLPVEFFWLLILPLLYIYIEELYSRSEHPLRNVGYSFLSVIYISIPLALSILIVNFDFTNSSQSYNPEILLGFFALIWINDSMAYIVGVPLGKNRLFKRVSPKKSWEGTIGGAVFTILASLFFSYFLPVFKTENWIAIAIIVIVFGTIGDLVESLFKRSIDIKDSGNILPGHGGILDRIDSFLFVIPFIWIYIIINNLI